MMNEMTMTIYVGAREQRNEVLEVAKRALKAKGFDQFADDLKADKTDCYMITNDISFDVSQENFDEAISTIYKAIIKELPDVVFQGNSWNGGGTCDMTHNFDKTDNTLKVETTYVDGEGICCECDTEVVDIDSYVAGKTYICPECGEDITNNFTFEKEEQTYEIINGELVKK